MSLCPICRSTIPRGSSECIRCGKHESLGKTAVAVITAELPSDTAVMSALQGEIVELTTLAKTPVPPKLSGPVRLESPKWNHRSGVVAAVTTSNSVSPTLQATRSGVATGYRKAPGCEPMPGYVLIEPLGRGGFGEVWKCQAPGGLLKAIKFVKGAEGSDSTGGAQLRQEYEAFEQVKAIRHPFLLCLERVELVADELVMVMGLADKHIGERFEECRKAGLPGIPREELISYLREAAEALDVISAQYGLQHLDVKPANLFLTAGHLQVGDYGLVSKLDGGTESGKNRGLTPKYAAPEVLRGQVHTQSDQYSLALVYQELLTGCFPYSGRTAQQMMLMHVSQPPDLTSLPTADRDSVARALSKTPDQRYASCLDFIDSLGPTDSRLTRRSAAIASPGRTPATPSGAVSVPPATRAEPGKIRLGTVRSVMATEKLQGRDAPVPACAPAEVIDSILSAASGGQSAPASGEPVRLADGTWSCRFLTAIDPRMAKVKLDLVWEEGGLTMDAREEHRVVFRKIAPGFRLFGKKETSGFEVVVHLPETGGTVGEVEGTARIYGSPKQDFVQAAESAIPALFATIRGVLNNVKERRKYPRLAAGFPVTLYPVLSDGTLDTPVRGECLDVSEGGLAILAGVQPSSKYFYAVFDKLAETKGLAILVQTIKSHASENGFTITGRFRTDL